jgi:hypothetical protein
LKQFAKRFAGALRDPASRSNRADHVLELVSRLQCTSCPIGSAATEKLGHRDALARGCAFHQLIKLRVEAHASHSLIVSRGARDVIRAFGILPLSGSHVVVAS